MGRPRKIVEGEAAIKPPDEPVVIAKPVPNESLSDYVARLEEQVQPLTICEVTHPGAVNGAVHAGKYSGIRLKQGDKPSAIASDGTIL